ncbi:MAG: hypothetical protein WBX11_11545 [Thiobacillaceae bacterium]
MPGPVVINVEPATVVMTGIEFMQYANHYLAAAEYLSAREPDSLFDPLPYQLLCQSLELHLKSYIWLVDRLGRKTIKNKYGHDIEKLWRHAKDRRIVRYCQPTPMRDEAVGLVGPYYKDRKFTYLDLSMSWEGIPKIRAHPKVRAVLTRLCRQMSKSLRAPILHAS